MNWPHTKGAWGRLKTQLVGLRRDKAAQQLLRWAESYLDASPNESQREQAFAILQALHMMAREEIRRLRDD